MIIFKKLGYCFLTACILFLVSPPASHGDENTRSFLDGIRHYESGNFTEAIAAFSRIAESGVSNGKLFYNLANAYLKNGDVGRAILWYERALKLIPGDPGLKFNHEYALSQVKDEKEERAASIFRILFFWKHAFSPETIRWSAVLFNLIFWGIVAVRMLQKKRRILKGPAYLALTLAVVLALTAFYNQYEAATIRHAIILPAEVSVRSGLKDDSAELFLLHAGTKVKIEKEHKDFYRIYFSEGKIGWVRKADVGVL